VGSDELFSRHPDIIKVLCTEASVLLPIILDGLIWRSRQAENGKRRVNYYVKHLLVDSDGHFNQAMEWIADLKDPKIVCHPLLVLLSDIVWNGPIYLTFLFGRCWLMWTACMYVIAQSILANHLTNEPDPTGHGARITMFAFRLFIYGLVMGHLNITHMKKSYLAYKAGEVIKVRGINLPAYLTDWQEFVSLWHGILLLCMMVICPVLYCWPYKYENYVGRGEASQSCPQMKKVADAYGILSAVVMILYFLRLIDMTAFSNKVSAYVLMCGHVLPEVGLYLIGMSFTILMFSAAVNSLNQAYATLGNDALALLTFLEIGLRMYDEGVYNLMHESGWVYALVIGFVITISVFLINLLIAQIGSSYAAIYNDMLGYARLRRINIINTTMPFVAKTRWNAWVESLRLEDRLEFNQGDVGLPGGIQVTEPASANPTTVDSIRRFGGSTSPAMQWPEEDHDGDGDNDRFDRLEKMLQRLFKARGGGGKRKGGAGSSGAGSSGGGNTGTAGSGEEDEGFD